ncbi:Protein of unknown function DUF262 [Pseudomonas sp. NFACC24-1]|uniref:DUF262 domain-containing protein n=1 Tax=Pseudomonas sp. NFACC24-1 TaxID=1566189 RepID=UPI0008E7EE20|nr:DUF262 domain-containing protein [Pseudomonas sp. NFACC24-1]SFO39648.1 Protein of unknown function DUF262 [Pseudomonas sp. NFACC24-1]
MKINAKDPDISSIYQRIKRGSIDLRPDFQRDMVWNKAKKQGLIDTILRDWKFPPVFFVVTGNDQFMEVLDGQQRLSAIVEFLESEFAIDGNIEPYDEEIRKLNGLRFDQLPDRVRFQIEQYSIRIHELYDYQEGEPYELFFRLNQGVTLTPAEKRNTFFGPVREQIKNFVSYMSSLNIDGSRIGFNNNRLAYDDVIARFVYAIHTRIISKKITDVNLVEFYRAGAPVSRDTEMQVMSAIDALAAACSANFRTGSKLKLNKSTLLTWLIYFANDRSDQNISHLPSFERMRESIKSDSEDNSKLVFLLGIYQERAASSVNDAIPVQLRLLVIYLIGWMEGQVYDSRVGISALAILDKIYQSDSLTEEMVISFMEAESWGLQ